MSLRSPLRFQFHKGTIKTIILTVFCLVLSNFNSIKVRLKLLIFQRIINRMRKFQFHKGTIKTETLQSNIDAAYISIP